MKVEIHFEIPDGEECERTFKYLQEHPKDIWDYEERVQHTFQENYDKRFAFFHTKGFEPNFTAHWSNADILKTQVTRLNFNIIQYKVTLRAGVTDPRMLVDVLRRCKCVQEGVVGGNWTIHAWYCEWTADPGNDGQRFKDSLHEVPVPKQAHMATTAPATRDMHELLRTMWSFCG